MNYSQLVSSIYIFLCLISCCSVILAQQPYIRKATTLCDSTDNSTSVLGYTCNGISRSCQTYLTFRAQPQFDRVSTISKLLGVDPSQLSQLNSVAQNATFETDQMVLIPVTCSCSGQYYQANASYVIQHENTYFFIANNTFQGLSTCQALQAQNSNLTRNLYTGTRITVPLRCACPTKSQSDDGVKYLLSYLVTWGQYVSMISEKFRVNTGSALKANGLSEQDFTVYPFTTLLVPLQDPPSSSQSWVFAVVGVLGGLIIASVVGTIIFCMFYRKKKQKTKPASSSQSFESVDKPLNKKDDEESQNFWDSISSIAQSLKVYTFEELRAATEDFSPACLIKGSVYRGSINGDFAAIKKMNGDVSKEINLLNKINHFNLIRLSGVGFNEGNWYLVYEYAVNGPLSDWIHNIDQKLLTWNQRVQIALDIATGLNYLHRYTSPSHVHKDLNSSNILLDGDFRAKIANFGLARSTDEQEGQFALTRHIVGTKGYMAPEYLENGLITPKLDVYAFGILMLEILTGKEVAALYEGLTTQLTEMLIPVLHEENGKENLRNLMDSSLQGKYPSELAMLVLRQIDHCLKKEPSHRPSMDEILQSLSRISTSTLSYETTISISEYHTLPR
ncbi:LysM domain receptor-like kinase 4 [Forsythia ovata]|uniref:LysM domain receptor-like kinase 4 n=1 Tax=Forsythia ovata TaxID=205694 RepID=A0ABD1UD10_9LAMI